MSAPPKVTDAQIAFACQVMEKRREALRVAKLYPTLAQLALQMGVSYGYMQKLVAGRAKRTRA
jgi:hypothetical protein